MNGNFITLTLAGVFALSAALEAAQLPAKLVMPGDKSWEGTIIARDGEWIEFQTGTSARAIRIGAKTVKELVFEVKIDSDKLNEMNRNREYERIISSLDRVLAPFAEFGDIPSNLTVYKALLMELRYKTGDYDKSMAYADQIIMDDRDPALQDKSRVFKALSLIGAGRVDEAEKLMAEYGWSEGLEDDASPEKLYITAKLLALKKQYADAMELVAKIIAFNSQDPDWMQPAELLCAEIYTELGAQNPMMYDSAEEVIRQISLLYKNTNEDDQAQKLKIRIEGLRAEQELKQSEEV